MKLRHLSRFFAAAVAAMLCTQSAVAAVKLPAIFGDHMVVQRGKKLKFWGWASPGERIKVDFGRDEAASMLENPIIANKKGEWSVELGPFESSSKPMYFGFTGKTQVILKDVLVGEVWVCSGQSNMEMAVVSSKDARKEIAAAKHPQIRLFHIQRHPAGTPQKDVKAKWRVCTPESIPGFSAVAYYFGRKLNKELKVPIGLIATSWGGTRIEPWTPPVGFASVKELKPILKRIKDANEKYNAANPKPKRHPLASAGAPTGLYNGMVAPIVPFAIRGAIWYQGESNRNDGAMYAKKMHALINGWRKIWKQGDFPFYYVQLAPYRYGRENVEILAKCWEAQTDVLKMKNTGMAVTVDIGNLRDIHPKDKQDVGKRLALWALAKDYGKKDLVYSGPLYKSMKVEGDSIRVSFHHVGGGLISRDGKPLSWFEIAGKDGKFVKANAKIDGKAVVVSSTDVKHPTQVRFGWSMLAEPNLSNKEGLPASPFRTNRK